MRNGHKKKETIFTLVPESFRYEQFLTTIYRRNKWLITLRYWATLILTVFIVLTYFIKPAKINTLPLWIIDFCIILYNIGFDRLWNFLPKIFEKYPNLNSLHFSLLQITADYLALMCFIYYTGGVETPLYSIFILHVIIGSLLLPRAIVTSLIVAIVLITASGAYLECFGLIPHQGFTAILGVKLYNNIDYISFHFIVYTIILLVSNYFANSISKELYKRERSLTDAYNKIGDSEKAKSRYVMSIVHDLKTPISAAITYMNLLLNGTLGHLKQEFYRPVERSRKRLTDAISTINDILQISQLKIDERNEETVDVNLLKIFDEIYYDMMIIMVSKGIDYSFETDFKNEVFIKANPKLAKLAFANLISNACKYTEPHGKIEVDILDKKDYILITVTDSGIGIPASEKAKIFQDFYRSSVTKRKGIEGSGLGMSVVSHFINRMNGTINIESPSKLRISDDLPGTSFIINIPKKLKEKASTVSAFEHDELNW